MFWRWPGLFRLYARDGQPHFWTKAPSPYRCPQPPHKTLSDGALLVEKIGKLRRKQYLETGTFKSLVPYFYVPKGTEDIMVVFNGTSCGLNGSLFALHFSLPTVTDLLRSVEPGSYQADSDYQEMFYNFLLHPSFRELAGVDVTHVRTREVWEVERKRCWERFCRNYFGQTDSPGRSIQMGVKGKQLALGDRIDPMNPYQWDHVEMNLPGNPSYNPTRPWVSKRRKDGCIASDSSVYVDDG